MVAGEGGLEAMAAAHHSRLPMKFLSLDLGPGPRPTPAHTWGPGLVPPVTHPSPPASGSG